MGDKIVFDGEKTLSELVEELFDYAENESEVTAICEDVDEYPGYEIIITLRKRDTFDA